MLLSWERKEAFRTIFRVLESVYKDIFAIYSFMIWISILSILLVENSAHFEGAWISVHDEFY